MPTDLKKRCKMYRKMTTPAQYAALVQELAVRLGLGDALSRLGVWDELVAAPGGCVALAADVQAESEQALVHEPRGQHQPASKLQLERAVRRARRKRALGEAADSVHPAWRLLLGVIAFVTAVLELVVGALLKGLRLVATAVDLGHAAHTPKQEAVGINGPRPASNSDWKRLTKSGGGGGGRQRRSRVHGK